MPISLSELTDNRIVKLPNIPTGLKTPIDALTLLSGYIRQASLQTQVKPLTHEKLPWIQDARLDYKEKPERITRDQLQTILELAPGHTSIDIGELVEPVTLEEMVLGGKGEKVTTSILVATEKKQKKGSCWDIWAVDESGSVYCVGFQT